jgi:hypothetical protein
MKRVLMLVEGPTEDRFVKDILRPHLQEVGIVPIPTILTTKKVKAGPDFKGGVSSFHKIKNDLDRLFRDSDAVLITTIFDYYGFPKDFPGWPEVKSEQPHKRVEQLEAAINRIVNHPRFTAHLMLHEYEGMLFSDPDRISEVLGAARVADRLREIRTQFADPEEINDGPETAPSKRLIKLLPQYRKRLHGPLVVERIGLEKVRSECPHFDAWVTGLESLGSSR